MNAEVELMKATPGKYVVSNEEFRQHGMYAMVEVDDEHVVHQLTPHGRRDGLLSDDGWLPNTTVWKFDGTDHLVRINDQTDRINVSKWRDRA